IEAQDLRALGHRGPPASLLGPAADCFMISRSMRMIVDGLFGFGLGHVWLLSLLTCVLSECTLGGLRARVADRRQFGSVSFRAASGKVWWRLKRSVWSSLASRAGPLNGP